MSKLKTVKKFDENGKNADPALVEINHERYGLPNRTGVDFERFDTNRMSGKPLRVDDKDVFPEDQERFILSSHDTHNVLVHTGVVSKKGKKKEVTNVTPCLRVGAWQQPRRHKQPIIG